MPKPTNQNRISFKNYLRSNKQKFTSGIQTCALGDIQDAILTLKAGINTSQVTRVIIFDDGEKVGLATVLNQRQLFYVPALPNDSIIIGVGTDGDAGIKSTKGYKLTFVGDGDGIEYQNKIYGLDSKIGLGTDISLRILGLGGGLFLPEDPPTYSITPSVNIVNEGETVSFAVTTTNVGIGTTLYYTLVGSASSSDFLDNTLNGSFTIESISNGIGIGSFSKTIATDQINEPTEGFLAKVLTGSSDPAEGTVVSTASTVYIQNVEPPVYSVGVSTTTVIEGGSVSFTVNTTNVSAGTTLYYSTSGTASAADFSNNSLTGSFSIVGIGSTTGIATITRAIANDVIAEGSETFNLVIRTGSISGTAVTTSQTVTIENLPFTINVGVSTTLIAEPKVGIATTSIITFTITTTGIPNGKILLGQLVGVAGTLTYADVNYGGGLHRIGDFSTQNYTITITNNSSSLSIPVIRDGRTEGNDQFKLNILDDLGTVVASSSTVTILDTSFIGSRKTNKTFGPILVNRDNGNTNQTSDWYTICELDKIPDSSKVVLFIDTSGSMTEGTVSASKALLLSKLAQRNIDVTVVTNSDEDWITPFDTI